MRFIIEFDGPLADIAEAHYAAHVAAATQVGWSRLDRATFWRLTRTKGADADLLPGANENKVKDYRGRFEANLETAEILALLKPVEEGESSLSAIVRQGRIHLITLGMSVVGRRALLESWRIARLVEGLDRISPDPRQRPAELRVLGENDPRAIVVACSDALIRAADNASLFTVGLSCGACGAQRMQRAGPRIVYKELSELADSLRSGGNDLIRAGLLPPKAGL